MDFHEISGMFELPDTPTIQAHLNAIKVVVSNNIGTAAARDCLTSYSPGKYRFSISDEANYELSQQLETVLEDLARAAGTVLHVTWFMRHDEGEDCDDYFFGIGHARAAAKFKITKVLTNFRLDCLEEGDFDEFISSLKAAKDARFPKNAFTE